MERLLLHPLEFFQAKRPAHFPVLRYDNEWFVLCRTLTDSARDAVRNMSDFGFHPAK